jgi:hypothetical protein
MKLNAFHCDINTKSTFIVLKRLQQYFHLQLYIQKSVNLDVFHLQIYKNICQLTTCKLFDNNFNFRVKILSIVQKSCILNRFAAFSERININSLILHSMQSAILDDKSSPRAYPRDEIAAQARRAELLNHVGFWQASHRLSEVRELRDACGGG